MDGQFGWSAQVDVYWRKGPWTSQEDKILVEHVSFHGEGRWNSVSRLTGLRRSGKSCRLRWVNYLRPDLKRGKITPEEESIIIELHALWGNRWSTIARNLPGRTDNEIKNYWRTHFKKDKPSKNVEKARSRFLMQKKEQQRQKEKQKQQQQDEEQKQELQQQELQQQLDAMSMMMNYVDEVTLAQDLQDMAMYMCPLTCSLHQDDSGDAPAGDGSALDSSWGSLWNLDYVHDGFDQAYNF